MRKKIQPGESVPVRISQAGRQLFLDHSLGDPEYMERLRPREKDKGFEGDFTLDDLEDILGCIAMEANHTDDDRLKKRLDALFVRLHKIQRSYDDGGWSDSSA